MMCDGITSYPKEMGNYEKFRFIYVVIEKNEKINWKIFSNIDVVNILSIKEYHKNPYNLLLYWRITLPFFVEGMN